LALLSTRSVADSAMFAIRGEMGESVARGTFPSLPTGSARLRGRPGAAQRPGERCAQEI
jgi:hypothetical protein